MPNTQQHLVLNTSPFTHKHTDMTQVRLYSHPDYAISTVNIIAHPDWVRDTQRTKRNQLTSVFFHFQPYGEKFHFSFAQTRHTHVHMRAHVHTDTQINTKTHLQAQQRNSTRTHIQTNSQARTPIASSCCRRNEGAHGESCWWSWCRWRESGGREWCRRFLSTISSKPWCVRKLCMIILNRATIVLFFTKSYLFSLVKSESGCVIKPFILYISGPSLSPTIGISACAHSTQPGTHQHPREACEWIHST